MENQLKATELRLGNYLFDRNNRLCQVKELGESIKAPAIKGARTSLPNKPIPLTEEILLRLGFEIEWLLSDSKGYYVLINNKKIRIKFVHSLQNIYFYIEKKDIDICL